ncbi:MAG: biotin--[acetyl-CoA-carboxylase] ligase [Acidobacteriota bacterium]
MKRLRRIECVAVIPRVSSTNILARRISDECFENDLPVPSAILLAGEQLAGKGRGSRTWYSPPEKGIYATTMQTITPGELPLLPLEIGNIVAGFLRETYALDARLKWPNDVLVQGRKIAGILIEARTRDDEVAVLIGTGINVSALGTEGPEKATSIVESAGLERSSMNLSAATTAFIEYVDARLAAPLDPERILAEWNSLSAHSSGDRMSCVVGEKTVTGTWGGIDDRGRAVIEHNGEKTLISAGDLIVEIPYEREE